MLDLLSELNRDGLTLVLVTHDASMGERAERLVRMRDGAIQSETAV